MIYNIFISFKGGYMSHKPVMRFFVSVISFSWSMLLITYFTGYQTFYGKIFFALGGVSPTMFGLIYMNREYSKRERKLFIKRLTDFRLIGISGYSVIIFFIPSTALAALLLVNSFFGVSVEIHLNPAVEGLLPFLSFVLFTMVFGPLAEEIGWRGYALDRLEKIEDRIKAAFILATIWALWHLPMFFITGTYQNGLLADSPLYLLDFIIAFYPVSIIMDWLYHKNNKSILAGILFHFAINFYGEITDLPNEAKPVRTLIQIAAVVLILVSYKKEQHLKNRQSVPGSSKH